GTAGGGGGSCSTCRSATSRGIAHRYRRSASGGRTGPTTRTNQPTRGGWKFERAPVSQERAEAGADSNLHSPQEVEDMNMAVTTEPRTATVSVTIGEQELSFETGKLAKQADGAVLVRAGETMVLATAQGKLEA